MRWFDMFVATLVAGAFVAAPAPALAQGRGRALGSSGPMVTSPGLGSSTTGAIPGTLGGTPFNSGGSMTGGIPGTLGSAPFNSGGSTTGVIGTPSTQGTSTTGSTDLLGTSVFGSASGPAR